MEEVIAQCKICLQTETPGFSHWGFEHVCKTCWESSHRWNAWKEEDLVRGMNFNRKAIATVFHLINRNRRNKRSRAQAKRARQIMNETRVTRGHGRILPNLRKNRLAELGYTV